MFLKSCFDIKLKLRLRNRKKVKTENVKIMFCSLYFFLWLTEQPCILVKNPAWGKKRKENLKRKKILQRNWEEMKTINKPNWHSCPYSFFFVYIGIAYTFTRSNWFIWVSMSTGFFWCSKKITNNNKKWKQIK